MGIVREISPELDPVEFPDNMDEAAVDAFMAQRGRELRQGLIARRQAQLAAETEGDEALRYAEGGVPFSERVGSTILAAPQSAMRQTGQTLRGLGEFLATAPIPRERGEIAPEIVRENIRRAQRPREQVEREVEASPTRRLGGEMVAAAPEAFPTLPGVRESLPSQVSGGIGSVGALLPAGLTGPAAPFVGGAMYGLSAGEDFADDAEQVINSRIAEALAQGNTSLAADLERRKFDMKNTARMAGRAIGAGTEGVLGLAGKIRVGKSQIGGIGARLAERMVPKTAPVAVQNAVRGAVEGGLTEAAQEGTEQILGNAAALAVYDPNRGIMDDVAQSVLVGGLTGKVVGGAFGSRGQNRDPLPASRAAVVGEVVPGTEIPQDIGAPDLTLEDVGDLLPVEKVSASVQEPPVPQAQTEGLAQIDRSGTPVPVTQETPENMGISQDTPVPEAGVEPAPETPAVDSPTLSPAIAAETPTAPEKPASPAPSSSVEGVTGEKPKRTRKVKRVAGVAPVVASTPAIPPDDTAMEAATAAAMAPGTPAPVTTAPDEGIAERAAVDDEMTLATTRVPEVAPAQVGMPDEGIAGEPEPTIPPLPTELAEAIAADEAPDVFVDNTVRKFGESERASAQSTKPNERQRQVIEQGKRIAAEKGWDWNKVKETARLQLGLNENFLKPDSRADQVFKMMREEDAAAAKRGQRTAEEMARIDAETKARRDKEAADKAEKEATQRRQAEEKAAESERQTAQEHDQIVAKLPKKWMASWNKAKTKKAKAKLLNEAMVASGTRNEAALTAALDRAQQPTITEAPAAEPAAAQAAEVATPEVVKQSKPPMAPKAQKAYLLEKIDEAIATAPEGSGFEIAAEREEWTGQQIVDARAKALSANKAKYGTVTIEVPGDGTFEILNNKQSLKAFKDKAKKFPTGKTGPSDASLPAKSQSRPATVGKSEKASFIESAKAFVSDGDKVVPTTRFIFSDKTKSVATDGKKLLVWDSPIGPEGFYTTEGKKTNESGRFLDYNAIISAPMNKVFKGLNTERLFNLVKQAMATVPDKRNAGTARSPKWVEQPRIVQIYRNQDGSIGVLAEGIDEAAYVHNVRKGSKLLTKLNGEQFLEIIQASRRMGSDKVDISFSSDDPQLGIVGVTWPDGAAYVTPMRGGLDSTLAESLTTGEKQPDILERALNAAIKATDRTSATFSDPFLIAAVGLPVLNAALRIVRRVYLKTRDLARAKRQGMRLIRRQLRTDPKADLPRIEEAFNQLVEGTAEKPGPDQIEAFQAADGSRRQKSRGLFTGDVTVDTDAEWQAGAERWINQFNGNIRRAFEAARSTDYATTGLNPAAQNYVFGRLLEMSEIAINAARNDVDMVRNINLQKEIADASKDSAAEAAKALGSRALVQKRILWMYPILDYRNLIRENQKRLPFPDVVADEVRTWLQESGRRAVQEMRNAMTDADKVFARELKTTVRDMRVVWRDVMTSSVESQEAMRRKILEELVKAPELKGLSRQGYIDIANLLGKAWERERARIFAAEFRKQVPLPSVKEDVRRKLFTAIPDILKWANLGLLDNEAFRNAVAPKFGVAKFDGETAKKLNEMAQRAQKVDGSNRKRIIDEMYNLMQVEGGVRWPDIVRDYWYAAVLGAVNTQVDNGLGVINGALNTVMGMAMSDAEVRKAMGKSYVKGFSEGIADFFPILWNGEVWRSVNFNPDQPANTLNALSKSGNLFARGLSKWKYVSRLMTALDHINALSTDQAMKAYALGRRLPIEHVRRYMMPSENVLRTARLKAEAEGTPPNLMRKRVREIVQESIPVEVLISSKDIRELVTFTNQPKGLMGALYRGVQEMEKKAPGFKVLSGTNFLRFAANYSNEILNYVAPVALYRYYVSAPSRADGRLGLKMGQEERQLILAKLAVGTALGTFAAALFLGDDDDEKDRKIDITGSFKSLDPNKRKQLLSEGRAPYSIRIGDKYVSYRQLPFGGVLGAIGELRDRQLYNPKEWNQESIARKFVDGAFAGSLIVRDSPAISSFTEFLGTANAYKYDMNEQVEKSLPKYIARLGGSFIPRIAKEIDAWADPAIYKANTGHEFFLQQMPIFRRELGEGPVLNVLGEPVQVERYPWSRWIRTRKEDKAWSTLGELASKGVFLPVPSVTVKVMENGKRREMTPAESYRYQQRVGQAYRKFVEDNSERLLRMKPDEATDFIDTQTERIRSRIRSGGA